MTERLTLAAIGAALTITTAVSGTTAHAGDPAAGEQQWRQCRSCHMIVSPANETIQRGGRVGPNLYGIAGAQAGAVAGFRYSAELVAAGQAGLTWTEGNFVAYVEDPSGFLRSHTGNSSIRSPMNFQLRSGAADLFAYIESVSN
jgi:cytochrome c